VLGNLLIEPREPSTICTPRNGIARCEFNYYMIMKTTVSGHGWCLIRDMKTTVSGHGWCLIRDMKTTVSGHGWCLIRDMKTTVSGHGWRHELLTLPGF
jgi:hypothetical protein